MVFFVILERVI